MARARLTATSLALVIALTLLALTGCGGSTSITASKPSASQPPAPTTTHASTLQASTTPTTSTPPTSTGTTSKSAPSPPAPHRPLVAQIVIKSPAVPEEGVLPARYTCDGQDISPPLQWTGIPSGTKELAIFLLSVNGVKGKFFFNWAITGLNPASHGIPAGFKSPNTTTATNSYGKRGYRLCQAKHTTEQYVAILYALPHPLKVKPGFDPNAVRHQALGDANYSGHLFFTYTQH